VESEVTHLCFLYKRSPRNRIGASVKNCVACQLHVRGIMSLILLFNRTPSFIRELCREEWQSNLKALKHHAGNDH
jgi:hypothetical protein